VIWLHSAPFLQLHSPLHLSPNFLGGHGCQQMKPLNPGPQVRSPDTGLHVPLPGKLRHYLLLLERKKVLIFMM
jgi:hypothetical protein